MFVSLCPHKEICDFQRNRVPPSCSVHRPPVACLPVGLPRANTRARSCNAFYCISTLFFDRSTTVAVSILKFSAFIFLLLFCTINASFRSRLPFDLFPRRLSVLPFCALPHFPSIPRPLPPSLPPSLHHSLSSSSLHSSPPSPHPPAPALLAPLFLHPRLSLSVRDTSFAHLRSRSALFPLTLFDFPACRRFLCTSVRFSCRPLGITIPPPLTPHTVSSPQRNTKPTALIAGR